MKRLGTCAVLLSMIAAVVVSAGYLRGVRMQRVVPATVPPDECIFRARLLFAGDVMAHLPQLTAARRSDGTHDFFGQFRLVKPRFDAADLVEHGLRFGIGNLDVSRAVVVTSLDGDRDPANSAREPGANRLCRAVDRVDRIGVGCGILQEQFVGRETGAGHGCVFTQDEGRLFP